DPGCIEGSQNGCVEPEDDGMGHADGEVVLLAAATDGAFDLRQLALEAARPATDLAGAQVLGGFRKPAAAVADLALAELGLAADLAAAVAEAAARLADGVVLVGEGVGHDGPNFAGAAASRTLAFRDNLHVAGAAADLAPAASDD